MLFIAILLYFFCITFAKERWVNIRDFFNSDENEVYNRCPRKYELDFDDDDEEDTGKKKENNNTETIEAVKFSCKKLGNTKKTSFVSIILYKTAGRYMGLGAIITPKSVLTARKVVENWVQTPSRLLCLAGWSSPWWGNGSQVKKVDEVFINEKNLALLNLEGWFTFNENIQPVAMINEEPPDYAEFFTIDFAVFGIFRRSWNVPGEKVSKTSRYVMRVETMRDDYTGLKSCMKAFPDHDFDENFHLCTFTNGSFSWGCIGSPTIALTKSNQIILIAIITKTGLLSRTDVHHIHTKIAPHLLWITTRTKMQFNL